MKGVIYMTKKERKKKKRQIMQMRKLAKAIEATHNKFYWVDYKSLKVIGASYSKQLCPTKRYKLRFKEMVIPYPNRKKRIFSSSAPLHRMSVRSDYAKSFLNTAKSFFNISMDAEEITTTSTKYRALSDEEIKTLKKICPKIDFNHKEVIRKKKF